MSETTTLPEPPAPADPPPADGILPGWADLAADPRPVQMLSDADVLAATDSHLPADLQEELSDLLYRQQDGDRDARRLLDLIWPHYHRAQMRKTEGLVAAVERGLRPRGPYGPA